MRETYIITPESDPHHETVGRKFKAHDGIFYCDSYDSSCGFWMTNIENPKNRRNVSERAIGSSFKKIYED